MKVIGLILIFSCCTLMGVWLDEDQRRRLKELEKFIYLFELLKGEIDYQLTPLQQACEHICQYETGKVRQVFLSFSQQLAAKKSVAVEKMWQEALVSQENQLHLKDEDYRLLREFGNCCGYLDKAMQTRNLEMVLEKLRHQQGLLEKKYEKSVRLNRSLGMLVGGALVIFLI